VATILTITESIKTLGQIEEKLGIRLSDDPNFFLEWLNLPATLSNSDRDRLDRIRQNYLYQSTDGILLAETIKLVLLSPLLELAGFYQFVKLLDRQYGTSDLFATRSLHRNNLYQMLEILRHLGNLAIA
jgi:hypothetical protein